MTPKTLADVKGGTLISYERKVQVPVFPPRSAYFGSFLTLVILLFQHSGCKTLKKKKKTAGMLNLLSLFLNTKKKRESIFYSHICLVEIELLDVAIGNTC